MASTQAVAIQPTRRFGSWRKLWRIHLPEWAPQGKCVGMDPDLFFPETPSSGVEGDEILEPKQVCIDCSVRRECLTFAFDTHAEFGIFGGTTGEERAAWGRGRVDDLLIRVEFQMGRRNHGGGA
jgi:WhiB family redox-sensing transcriptional regulator